MDEKIEAWLKENLDKYRNPDGRIRIGGLQSAIEASLGTGIESPELYAWLEQNGFVKPYTDREIKKREKVKIAGCLPALRRVFKGEIDLPIKEGKDMGKVGWPKGKKRGKRKAGRPKTRTSANGSADAEFSAITHNGRVYVALEDAQRIFGR